MAPNDDTAPNSTGSTAEEPVSATWFDESALDASRPTGDPGIGAVVLAAGEGRRFEGGYKLLESVDGEPMIVRAVRPFVESCLPEVAVVVGCRRVSEVRRRRRAQFQKGYVRVGLIGREASLLEDGCEFALVHERHPQSQSTDITER